MSVNISYILSEKGKKILIFNGYEFYHDKTNLKSKNVIWKCKNVKTCKTRLHVTNDEIIKEIGQHDHAASAANVDARNILNTLKEKASTSFSNPHQIISDVSLIEFNL